jgi:hypothetical protein
MAGLTSGSGHLYQFAFSMELQECFRDDSTELGKLHCVDTNRGEM